MAEGTTSSYIDIEKLTSPDFSPYAHANALVLSTNNTSDPIIDLTTPLSRALFDLQEIDSNIHTLTSRSAIDILTYTSKQNEAAARILTQVDEERDRLNTSYARLEKEILGKYSSAQEAKLHAEQSHHLLTLGRGIQRILNLARQFEALLADSGLSSSSAQNPSTTNSPVSRSAIVKEDHRIVLQASKLILACRDLMNGEDAAELSRINLVRTVRGRIFEDGEARILDYARRVVREFAISSLASAAGSTFKEAEDSKARFTSAAHILYLLSPVPEHGVARKLQKKDFEPIYLIRALQGYLQTAITSSSAGISRSLTQLPTLDRALLETSARCQNVLALEVLLRTITPPDHPFSNGETVVRKPSAVDLEDIEEISEDEVEDDDLENITKEKDSLLSLLLESLDTSSLPSYFWRSLASQLSSRVQETLNRGGFTARTLKASSGEIRTQIRDCVLRGSKMPSNLVNASAAKAGGREQIVGNWEREAAVMVGSVVGPLSR